MRSAEEVGRGLARARAARSIRPGERIHVVGAAGAGASAAVLLAHRAGAGVTGCDAGGASPYTAAAEAIGIALAWEHHPDHVVEDGRPRVDRVAVTKALTAVAPNHPELAAARAAKIPVEPWQQVIADAAATQGGRLVGVAGTHGKSTSSGWLVHLLAEAGRDPGAFVGALLRDDDGLPSTARWGNGDVFIVEADEYAGNFDPYRPSVGLLLDADWDHPDVFPDEAAVREAFEGWIRRMEPWRGWGGEPPVLVAHGGDPGTARLLERLVDADVRLVAYALGDEPSGRGTPALLAGFRTRLGPARPVSAVPVGSGKWRILDLPQGDLEVTFGLPGRHNAANGLGVAATAAVLGVPPEAIARGLASFGGVRRRLERKGEVKGVLVLDDYGHHPTAIAATLSAVRERYPGRRLWAVYEPLTYHRTVAMLDAFADVLATADQAVVADIWAGRDPDTTIVSAADLAEAVNTRVPGRATAPGSVESTADHLAQRVESGDVVLVMGGGRSYVIAERLVGLLEGKRLTDRPG